MNAPRRLLRTAWDEACTVAAGLAAQRRPPASPTLPRAAWAEAERWAERLQLALRREWPAAPGRGFGDKGGHAPPLRLDLGHLFGNVAGIGRACLHAAIGAAIGVGHERDMSGGRRAAAAGAIMLVGADVDE